MSDSLVESNRLILKQSYGYTRPGLGNVSQSSFMNASIQALFACEQFRVYVILISNECPELGLYKFFSDLFIRMVRGMEEVITLDVNPEQITNYQNPERFLTQVFDVIKEEYENISAEFWLPGRCPCPTDVFAGRIELVCNSCQQSKWIKEDFEIIPFRINAWRLDTISVMDLYKCFIAFNYFYGKLYDKCENCNCYMMLKTYETPGILMLQLKYNEAKERITRPKLNIEDKIIIDNVEYLLLACICHEKIQTEDQYYCCYVRFGDSWYYFNDSTVKEIYEQIPSEQQLKSAYLLFYKKISVDIQIAFCNEVDSLIPPIQNIPLSFHIYPKKTQSQLQLQPPKIDSEIPDLIHQSLGNNKGLYNIGSTICYMSAALQALFHCEPFRLHILSEWHSGRFHTQLRLVFKALANNNIRVGYIYAHFYNSFGMNVRKEFSDKVSFSKKFLKALIFELNDEVKHCAVKYADLRPNVIFPYKPMSSTDAWIQFLIAQKNSYLVRIFTIQRKYEYECLNGHQYSYFTHSLIDKLMAPKDNPNDYFYIQMILDSQTEPEMQNKNCSECSLLMNFQSSEISHTCDVIIFELELLVDKSLHPFPYTMIRINEMITVCYETYYCQAIIVCQELIDEDCEHAFTYVKIGDDWYCFDDDDEVTLVSSGCMLNEDCYKADDRCVDLVFYEKLSPTKRPLTLSEQQLLDTIQWPQQQTD